MTNDLDRRFLLGGLAGAAGISALAAMTGRVQAAGSGPLNPPAGAVGSTAKPLADIEPRIAINAANTPGDADSVFRISQPGSYYLTANVLIPAGKSGIEIAASGVTIDLNGYALTVFGGIKGIAAATSTIERITIRNGRIVGGAANSAALDLAGIPDVTVENVAAESSGGPGIRTGDRAAVINCSAVGNTGYGITVGVGSRVERCTASSNTNTGIYADTGSVVTGCSSTGSSDRGFTLIDCLTSACIARENNVGYYAQGGLVTGCVSAQNNSTGFSLSDRTTIIDSYAEGNGASGISAAGRCTIRNNTCTNNADNSATGAGIYVASGSTLIEGNYCVGNSRGVRVVSSGNTLIGNIVRLSSLINWDIAANNTALVVAAASATAINGDSGGTSPGSTSAWANFTV